MDTSTAAGSLPAATPNAAPVVPASQPSSLPPVDKAFEAQVNSFKNTDEIMNFVESLKNTPAPAKKAEQAKPAEEPAGKPPAETPEAEPEPKPVEEPAEAPAEGDTPPTETAEDPPAEEPAATETEDEPDDDGELTPLTAKNIKVKPRDDDQVFRLQLRIMKRNRDLTGEEALARAKKELGLDKPAEAPEKAPARKPDGLPDSVDEIQATITRLKAERKTAASNLAMETYDQLTEQIDALVEKKGMVIEQTKQAQVQAQRTFDASFASSQAKAEDLYAFASDPNSPGGKLMTEIDNALEANGDPLFNDPNKPLKVAQMVATRLNIPPKTKSQPTAVKPGTPPKPQVPPAQKKDVIPGGSSGTTPRTVAKLNPLDQKIQENAKNPKALDDMLKSFGVEV